MKKLLSYKIIIILLSCVAVVAVGANVWAVAFLNPSTLRSQVSTIEKQDGSVITTPDWSIDKTSAQTQGSVPAQSSLLPASQTVNYTISTDGAITSDVNEFSTIVNQTLNDSRGWRQMGVAFQPVSSGGSLTIILTEASHVPNYSPDGCSSDLSCTVGHTVLINQDRWQGASSAWNASGASLLDYRRYVINHEVGHWLGHGHLSCSGTNQSSPIMLQQTISFQGCSPNPWPLKSELWSTTLGITI